MQSVNLFGRHLFNGTVFLEFRVCFTIAKCENNFHYLRHPRSLFSKINFHNLDREIIYAVYLQCGIFIHLVYVVKDIVLILLINLI